jgi:hypothetical protein
VVNFKSKVWTTKNTKKTQRLQEAFYQHALRFENITADPITFYHIDATVMRLDKIHPVISGNKWFKLQYYFEEARVQTRKESSLLGEPGPIISSPRPLLAIRLDFQAPASFAEKNQLFFPPLSCPQSNMVCSYTL